MVEPPERVLEGRSPAERSAAVGARRSPGAPPADAAAIRRRRIFALGIGLALVVAVVIVIVATGGGSSPAVTQTIAQTTPAAVTPPTTTPTPTTGQTTRPTKSTLRVTLPAGNLSRGGSGAPVVALQKALTALGYDAGTPDGNFGPTTEAAVIKFQKANGLTPDGIVGAKAAQALNQALASKNS